ncbi:hypothetical protein C2845_PM11G15160 [Panicum miliaceum]|uniref:Uncharacterized protein n=1 Tax=Panicum miliaceum TaxID=4540 RepID=A0A3L6RNB9_PANMI|nr:hypothetical protein C2845_PM11G15160 [Panicum miliaceum]
MLWTSADAAREEDAAPPYSTATARHPTPGRGGAKDCSSLVHERQLPQLVQVRWNCAQGAATASSGMGPGAAEESCALLQLVLSAGHQDRIGCELHAGSDWSAASCVPVQARRASVAPSSQLQDLANS